MSLTGKDNCRLIQNIVIYGWSISKQDNHILQRITDIQEKRKKLKGNVELPLITSIAVSIHKNDEVEKFIEHVKNKLGGITSDIDFYYSDQGCWCY